VENREPFRRLLLFRFRNKIKNIFVKLEMRGKMSQLRRKIVMHVTRAMLLGFMSLLFLPLGAHAQCQGCAGGMAGYVCINLGVGIDGAYGCKPANNGCTFTGPCYWIMRGRRATLDGPRFKLVCSSANADAAQQTASVARGAESEVQTL
jgi:hypothetical protein